MTRNLRRWSLVFLIPGLALYLYVVIVPSAQVVNYGFYEWSPGQASTFVGLGNYVAMFQDQAFLDALGHTFALLIGALIIQIPLGFFFAVLLQRSLWGRGFFQTVYFIPVILSSAVIAVLWRQVYANDFGLLNTILRAVGLDSLTRAWLGDTETALNAVVVVVGWQYVGLYMLIFLSAMQRIPPIIYEAGALDGATGWKQLRHLTMPMLFDTFKLSLILVATGAVQYFNLILAMTAGGPANSSSVLASYMFEKAFDESRLGFASAVATVMLVLNLIIAVGLQRAFRREPLELG